MSRGVVIRSARAEDSEEVFSLARAMATSFEVEAGPFSSTFTALLGGDDAVVLVANEADRVVGYLLGFDHLAFYANGRVSYVEEVAVREDRRRAGIGHALLDAFEGWARSRSSTLVTLATRRAAPFYLALDYEDTAVLFRKIL